MLARSRSIASASAACRVKRPTLSAERSRPRAATASSRRTDPRKDFAMPVSAFVCGCAGLSLTAWEKRFFREAQPWGLILFKRNVQDPAQLAGLTSAFREAVGRADAPVLVDQEGGRVQRLGPPHWPAYPSAASYLEAMADVE